ncbi:MAG TPA: histidine phosphatase family protein [Rhizomicrobium sp.]|jgi:phosphohistidine phosphatase
MKRLLLLRHAKASPDGKASRDHERELTARGRANAAQMGAWLHTSGYEPDLVLCSDAARTAETWRIAAQELDASPRVEFLEQLYLAPAKRIQAIIREAEDAGALLIVGHNPGMEDCAAELAHADGNAHRERMGEKFPTAALAVLEFDIATWRDMAPASGRLAEFIKPKDLKD